MLREWQLTQVEVMKIHLPFPSWLFRFAISPSSIHAKTDTQHLSSISENYQADELFSYAKFPAQKLSKEVNAEQYMESQRVGHENE